MSPRSDPAPGRPVIGLTAYEVRAAWGVWDQRAALLPTDYVQAIVRAGGVPVLLPPVPTVVTGALDRLDGLVVTGGPDVAPHRYGQEARPTTQEEHAERDDAELALVQRATELELPVLGICRGLQLLNVARGGTLVQHLPDVVGTADHDPGADAYADVPIEVEAGSRVAGALGRRELVGRCHHHQAVDAVGAGLRVVGRARADGTVEAVEDAERPFFLGVQWHPEVGDERRLFESLVAAVGART